MLLNRNQIEAAYTVFRADYEAGKLAAKPIAEKLAMTVQSATSKESYSWLGQNSSLREWLGDKQFNNLAVSGFTLKNKDYEHTIVVSRNDIEDDRIGVLSGAFKMMGEGAALHPDRLLFELIGRGTSEPCYDGQPFFSTAHPVGQGKTASTASNLDVASAGDVPSWFLLDTAKAIKPFILQIRKDYKFIALDRDENDRVFNRAEFVYGVEGRLNAGFGLWQLAFASSKALTATNIAAADAAMMSLKADNGQPLGIAPNVLLVSPAMKESALKLLKLETSHYRNAFELIVCPWL